MDVANIVEGNENDEVEATAADAAARDDDNGAALGDDDDLVAQVKDLSRSVAELLLAQKELPSRVAAVLEQSGVRGGEDRQVTAPRRPYAVGDIIRRTVTHLPDGRTDDRTFDMVKSHIKLTVAGDHNSCSTDSKTFRLKCCAPMVAPACCLFKFEMKYQTDSEVWHVTSADAHTCSGTSFRVLGVSAKLTEMQVRDVKDSDMNARELADHWVKSGQPPYPSEDQARAAIVALRCKNTEQHLEGYAHVANMVSALKTHFPAMTITAEFQPFLTTSSKDVGVWSMLVFASKKRVAETQHPHYWKHGVDEYERDHNRTEEQESIRKKERWKAHRSLGRRLTVADAEAVLRMLKEEKLKKACMPGIRDMNLKTFFRLFVAPGSAKKLYRFLEKNTNVDGTFYKTVTGQTILTLTGSDANNTRVILCVAIVHCENLDNWKWFLEKVDAEFPGIFTNCSDQVRRSLLCNSRIHIYAYIHIYAHTHVRI